MTSKIWKKPLSKVAHNLPILFFHSPAHPIAHSQELVFHIWNMSQDTSVSLSVAARFKICTYKSAENSHCKTYTKDSNLKAFCGCLGTNFYLGDSFNLWSAFGWKKFAFCINKKVSLSIKYIVYKLGILLK